MMFVSPHLRFDPTKPPPPEVQRLCGLEVELPPEVNLETFGEGQWWVYPLGRDVDSVLVGLRLVPGVALADSPVVTVRGAQAVTLASSPAALVPVRVHANMLRGGAGWNEIARLGKQTWKQLVALHHTLGGRDDLAALRALAADRAIKRAYERGSDDFAGLMTARLDALERLDPSPATASYARVVRTIAIDRAVPAPVFDAGCWTAAVAALVFQASRAAEDHAHPDGELLAAWQVVHELPGLDTARVGVALTANLNAASAAALVKAAAKVVAKRQRKDWAKDPLLPATEKLASSRRYDGAAHLAAARALERAGDHAAAFTAQAAAAFWRVQAKGSADRKGLEALRAVARKAGWREVADSLDEFAEAQDEVEADGG